MATKNKAYDLSSYSFQSGEQILIDTNIWLYLHPPPTTPKQKLAARYSEAFKKLVDAKAQSILDPMVLSEYLNAYAKIVWVEYKDKYKKYKDFRNSNDFLEVRNSASVQTKKIVNLCKIHSVSANKLNLNQALCDFASGNLDFNDAILVDICKKNDFKLMTNDSDFMYGGIDVLTTNRKILIACP